MDINKIHNQDCLEAMKLMQDNQFDLAIVDPPYGIGESNKKQRTRKKHVNRVVHKAKEWDNEIPSSEYFKELKRVSKNQIVWGANYMVKYLKPSMGWIFWEKKIGGDFSDGELAYTSFNRALKMFTKWSGGNNKIHPTQKPIALYEWLLMNYAKEGDKILDTHLGSGSIAIACHNLGYDLTGYELDKEYYDNAIKRIKNHQAQTRIF
jgi:site-specific DNA-methyltransferase (adenine-specific)